MGSDLHRKLEAFLRDWCRRASAHDTRDVAAHLAPLGAELVGSWNAHAARNRPNRFRRLRQRLDNLWPLGQQPNI